MKRIDQFREKMDALLDEFSDLSYEEIADELDFYSSHCQRKSNVG